MTLINPRKSVDVESREARSKREEAWHKNEESELRWYLKTAAHIAKCFLDF